jgi:GNAT superfamily N-acetyltransferase
MKLAHTHKTYTAKRLEDGRTNVLLHQLTATDLDGSEIGRIVWHDSNGEIEKLFVVPSHRRKGIATSLFNIAQWLNPAPKHSAWRTDDGDAWAKSITNELPERKYA